MAENITFDVLARDRASATFNKIARSTETMETRFTRLTRAATGVASVLVGAQLGKSVLDAADSFELSRTRLESVTTNIGKNFGQLFGQVDAADKRLAALGFTSAETEGALASLVAVTKNPTKALTDLALAADIARGRNIGLSEAVLILSRVETGHVAMLSKLGIATKDAAGHTLTQAQALQELTNLYGGAASRFAGTFAGKQQAVAASLKNSAAQIGVALLPAAVDLANVIEQDLLPPLVASAKWLDRNKAVVEPLAKVIITAVVAWKAYSIATRAAAAANLLFAGSAAAAEAGAAGSAAAAASRARLGGFGGALAGGAAIYGGSKLGGQAGSVLKDAGVGALVGSAFGPAGALVGAAGGASFGLTTNALNDFFPQKKINPEANLSPSFKKQVDALGGLDKATAYWRAQADKTKASNAALAASYDQSTAAARRTADQLVTAAQKDVALTSAQDALREAFQQGAQTAADSGRALVGNSDAALANRDAVRHEADAIFAVIAAMKQHGASAAAQASALSVLEQALEINATKTYGDKAAVDALLVSLGLIPQAVSNATSALAGLSVGAKDQFASGDITPGAATQRGHAAAKANAQSKAAGKKLGDSFLSGYTPVVTKAAKAVSDTAATAARALASSLQSIIDKDMQTIKDRLRTAQDQLTQDLQSRAQAAQQIASSLTQQYSLNNAFGPYGNVLQLNQLLAGGGNTLRVLRADLDKLTAKHLSAGLRDQILQAGSPQQAIALAQNILSGASGSIGSLNRSESLLQKYASTIGFKSAAEQYKERLRHDRAALAEAKRTNELMGELLREFKKNPKELASALNALVKGHQVHHRG